MILLRHFGHTLVLIGIFICLLANLVLMSMMSDEITPRNKVVINHPIVIIKLTDRYFWFDVYW